MEEHLCVKCLSDTCPNAGYDTSITKCAVNIPPKPKTNADRIRAMDDEELAEYMHRILENVNGNPETCPSLTFLKLWLSQEAN